MCQLLVLGLQLPRLWQIDVVQSPRVQYYAVGRQQLEQANTHKEEDGSEASILSWIALNH